MNGNYIDVNNNGEVDMFRTGELAISCTAKEPSFVMDYNRLREQAKEHSVEVATQDELPDLRVEDRACKVTAFGFGDQDIKRNQRPLKEFVREMVPFGAKNAKWAIDFQKDEFIIYEPKFS